MASTQTFDSIANRAGVPVAVLFQAIWCGRSLIAMQEATRAAKALVGRGLVLVVDMERHADLAERFDIEHAPVWILFDGGRLVRRVNRYVEHEDLVAWTTVLQATRAA